MNSDSFYCQKCEKVPLIEIAPKENELKILVSCQCRRQLLKAKSFFRYYYNPQLINLKSELTNESPNTNIDKLIQNYQNYKERFNNNCKRIKEEVINIYKTAIEKIQMAYEINKNINEKMKKMIVKMKFNNF